MFFSRWKESLFILDFKIAFHRVCVSSFHRQKGTVRPRYWLTFDPFLLFIQLLPNKDLSLLTSIEHCSCVLCVIKCYYMSSAQMYLSYSSCKLPFKWIVLKSHPLDMGRWCYGSFCLMFSLSKEKKLKGGLMNRKGRPTIGNSQPAPSIDRFYNWLQMYAPTLRSYHMLVTDHSWSSAQR